MSVDVVNGEKIAIKDVTWKCLIEKAEADVSAYRERIKALKKSIRFFKKQVSDGTSFPRLGN